MRIDLPCCGFKNCRYSFDGNCTKPSEQEKCEYWYILHEEPEVIRCKDCRWWDKSEDSPFGFGYCMAMKHGYMSANWEIGIYRRYKGDFYCADAERKEEHTMEEFIYGQDMGNSEDGSL